MKRLTHHNHPLRLSLKDNLFGYTAPSTAQVIVHNLATPPPPWVGRADELTAIQHHVDDPVRRLLTVTGPAGVGKTRLVQEAAQQILKRAAGASASPQPAAFVPSDGIYFAALPPLHQQSLIPEQSSVTVLAIAHALGLVLTSRCAPQEQLLAYVQPMQMLLVLDGVVHLPFQLDLIAAMLRRAPALKIVATAHTQLGMPAEEVLALKGLPSPAALVPDWRNFDGMRFFLQCANTIKPDKVVDTEEAEQILRICQRLDGLPLAIQLVAALLLHSEVDAIANTLADHIATAHANSAQRAGVSLPMHAALDLVWHALDERQRTVLMRLAVFGSAFSQRAAAEVCMSSRPLLAELVKRCLLHTVDAERYVMHEDVRRYLAGKRAERPTLDHDAWLRFCSYYANRVAQCVSNGAGKKTNHKTAELLNTDWHHLLLAWRRALAHKHLAALERLGPGLQSICDAYGLIQEGEALFANALAQLGDNASSELRGVLWAAHQHFSSLLAGD